jgi:hypothetical protein
VRGRERVDGGREWRAQSALRLGREGRAARLCDYGEGETEVRVKT